MALFDSIINEVSQRFGLGDKAAPLLSELLSLMTNQQTEGLVGFVDRFRQAGLGDLVISWISRGGNQPLTENQLNNVLGVKTVNQIASKAGVSSALATSALAFLVPRVIDLLTPNGTIPTGIPPAVTAFLSGGGDARHTATETASAAGSGMMRWLPLALLVLLGILGYRYCTRPVVEPAQTGHPSPISPSINSSLSLANEGGKIKFNGVVPDERTRQTILDQFKAVFGEDNFAGDIKVDQHARPVTWLSKLGEILTAFKIPGAELRFDGDTIKVAGGIAADQKAVLVDKIKSLLGAGYDISV
ncbi:MAG: YidB family protein [Acidobacteria bacterium]|nr:YidB family protein [Acidobacteriota bacterium]